MFWLACTVFYTNVHMPTFFSAIFSLVSSILVQNLQDFPWICCRLLDSCSLESTGISFNTYAVDYQVVCLESMALSFLMLYIIGQLQFRIDGTFLPLIICCTLIGSCSLESTGPSLLMLQIIRQFQLRISRTFLPYAAVLVSTSYTHSFNLHSLQIWLFTY